MEKKVIFRNKIISGKFSRKDWRKTIKSLLGRDKMEYILSLSVSSLSLHTTAIIFFLQNLVRCLICKPFKIIS